MERGAQIGGKGLIAFRGRVRTNTTEVSTGCILPTSRGNADSLVIIFISPSPRSVTNFDYT